MSSIDIAITHRHFHAIALAPPAALSEIDRASGYNKGLTASA
jgi:hypothetical protein